MARWTHLIVLNHEYLDSVGVIMKFDAKRETALRKKHVFENLFPRERRSAAINFVIENEAVHLALEQLLIDARNGGPNASGKSKKIGLNGSFDQAIFLIKLAQESGLEVILDGHLVVINAPESRSALTVICHFDTKEIRTNFLGHSERHLNTQ